MNDSIPITNSTNKKPSKRQMKKVLLDDTPRLSLGTGQCDTKLFIKEGNKLEEVPCLSKSVHSQWSMATTDTCSSVVSAESTISSDMNSEPSKKSALKRDHASTRNRSLQEEVPRRIRFKSAVQQRLHLALHEFTEEELKACWFQREEYDQITRSCSRVIDILEQEQKCRHDPLGANLRNRRKHCFRGLESHTRQGTIAKNQNRRVAWDAVLDEQYDQESLGVIDDEAIASRYHDASRSCRLWAIRIAQQDQRAAEVAYDVLLD